MNLSDTVDSLLSLSLISLCQVLFVWFRFRVLPAGRCSAVLDSRTRPASLKDSDVKGHCLHWIYHSISGVILKIRLPMKNALHPLDSPNRVISILDF